MEWELKAEKIDFVVPVRNCNAAEDSVPNKYLPLFLLKEKVL